MLSNCIGSAICVSENATISFLRSNTIYACMSSVAKHAEQLHIILLAGSFLKISLRSYVIVMQENKKKNNINYSRFWHLCVIGIQYLS